MVPRKRRQPRRPGGHQAVARGRVPLAHRRAWHGRRGRRGQASRRVVNAVRLTAVRVRYVNKAFWRNPASAFFTFAFPLMFLVIFTALLGHYTVRIGNRTVDTSTYYVASMGCFSAISACFNHI